VIRSTSERYFARTCSVIPSVKQTGIQVVATNRQARHRYTLFDTYECGIVLTGSEVKSLREAKVTLGEAWGSIDAGEVWLHGLHIASYTHAQAHSGHDATRDRKLLMHRHQIERIGHKMQVERLTLVPTRLYFSDGRAKIEMALGKGKNVVDKRQDIAKRDSERDAARDIANARRRSEP
jgi:SsrA-binding protein